MTAITFHPEFGRGGSHSASCSFCGPIGAGKSTAAKYLVDRHGYKLIKFAAPLRAMLRAIGLREEELDGPVKELPSALLSGATPRHAMQMLGTEWARTINPDFWVRIWKAEADQHLRVVVDDCRFRMGCHDPHHF
jgi:cytidylate kinase